MGFYVTLCFNLFWSDEDQEWVCTCSTYPSLSYLEETIELAFLGMLSLIRFIEKEDDLESFIDW